MMKHRPYWHVDLKWVFGILAFISLWAALFTNVLATLTEREVANELTTSYVASIFKNNDIDFMKFKAQATLLPDDAVITLPELPTVKITKADLLEKSDVELQQLAISQLTGPLYDQGLDKTASQLLPNPDARQSFKQQAGVLGVMSKSTHDALLVASKVALGTSLFFMLGAIFFSAGWGRLVTPGVILLLVTPVGLGLSILILNVPAGGDNIFAFVPSSVVQKLGTSMNNTYLLPAAIGFGLLMVAAIGKIITSLMHRKDKPAL